jgi:predicted dehydrogenase
MSRITRRNLLKAGLALGVAPAFIPARLLGENAPSNRTTLGFIGVGIHGLGYNLKTFLYQDDAHVLAVCDVFGSRRDEAAKVVNEKYRTTDCRKYADLRELLADNDIDAVCISTPDHWHVPATLLALAAGKHVMCEKPTLTIDEGFELIDAAKRSGRVFATGLEDRSVIHYHKLAQIVRNGAIGKVQRIEVTLPAGKAYPAEEPAAPPADLNYNLWLGPAPLAPYLPSRTDAQCWRQVRDYSGGKFTDWGAHLLDTAQVALGMENSGPIEAQGTGVIPPNCINTMPLDYDINYRYASGTELHVKSGGVAIKFIGTDGWVGNEGWRGRLQASNEDLLRMKFDAGADKLWPMPAGEHRNFLDAIRSGSQPTYPPEALHRLSTMMHVGNIAIELGRKVRWNPDAQKFEADEAAEKLRRRDRRDWTTSA